MGKSSQIDCSECPLLCECEFKCGGSCSKVDIFDDVVDELRDCRNTLGSLYGLVRKQDMDPSLRFKIEMILKKR